MFAEEKYAIWKLNKMKIKKREHAVSNARNTGFIFTLYLNIGLQRAVSMKRQNKYDMAASLMIKWVKCVPFDTIENHLLMSFLYRHLSI